MRMRKKKNLNNRLERVGALIVKQPAEIKGSWSNLSSSRPIHLEIGCGKGKFICEMAEANPDIFYVAMEKIANVLVTAVEKAFENKISNILFIRGDAAMLNEYFAFGEVSELYLNFSDPWPANRHRSRRLTSEAFLETYSHILSRDAKLCLKTDNRDFFDFSVAELKNFSWEIINITYNLHDQHNLEPKDNAQMCSDHIDDKKCSYCSSIIRYNPDGGIVTEYEEKFSSQGVPICRLEARPQL